MKPSALIVCDPSRKDIYEYLLRDDYNYFCIWGEIGLSKTFTKVDVLTWEKVKNIKQFLIKNKIEKVIFYNLSYIREISLMIIANEMRIETIFIDHGSGLDFKSISSIITTTKIISLKKNFIKQTSNFVKIRIEYLSCTRYISYKSLYSFFRFVLLLSYFSVTVALRKSKYKERSPQKWILFNLNNIQYHSFAQDLSKNSTYITGIPYFDEYVNAKCSSSGYIVYIDHPYLEQRKHEWDEDHHKKISNILFELSRKYKIVVKLHPMSDPGLWKSYKNKSPNFEIIQDANLKELLLNSSIILSYSSTLLIPLILRRKKIILLGWHPEPHIAGVDFSEFNVCKTSLDLSQIEESVNIILKGDESSTKGILTFEQKFNNPFDGHAKQRILNLIYTDL